MELHVLYQPGEDGAEEDENAERELAAVEREAKVVAAAHPRAGRHAVLRREDRDGKAAALSRHDGADARGAWERAAGRADAGIRGIPVFCDAGEGYTIFRRFAP